MTDTVRTHAELLALLADNHIRAIDAQALRDAYVTLEGGASGVIDVRRRHGAVGDNQKTSSAANTTAIQNAIDEAYNLALGADKNSATVYIPPGIYFVNGLTMKTQVTLCGAGPSTVLRLNDNITAPLITISGNHNHCNIRDMRLRGNKYGGGGGGAANAIDIQTNEEADTVRAAELFAFHGDAQHRLYNLTIDAVDGYGLYLWTRECHVDNVMIADVTQHGMRIKGSDNWFTNMSLNWIAKNGIFVEGGNNQFIGVKCWYIGTDSTPGVGADGFRIDSSRNLFIGCQAQDVGQHGFYIYGQDYNTLIGCLCDNIGNFFANTGLGQDFGPSGTQTGVYLDTRGGGDGAKWNSVQVQIAQRSGTAQMARAVAVGESAEQNVVHVLCNPAHVRSGGPITTWHSSTLAHTNIVYENGHRITPLINAGNVIANDATPSVKHVAEVTLSETTGALTVTALDDGRRGQEVLVKIGTVTNGITIDFSGTTLKGNGGVNWSPANGDAMICRFDGTNWYCSIVDATA